MKILETVPIFYCHSFKIFMLPKLDTIHHWMWKLHLRFVQEKFLGIGACWLSTGYPLDQLLLHKAML